jgi:very-long-chain (3R)-3-hydroxyacyl-CoA dehydratase
VVNSISVIGWGYILLKIGLQIFINREEYLASDISFDVMVLKGVQLFQIMDIILIVIGKSKGSLLGGFFQILGRNIVSLVFISEESDRLRFATVAIIWAMADINRYMYYLFKDNALTGFLRYNSFILLYPIGVFGEMMIINNFIKLNSEWLLD